MLSVATVQAEKHERYVLVRVLLENHGASVVKPGTLFGRQTSEGGAVRHVEFRNSNSIKPGSTRQVSQLLSAMSELELTAYRQSDGVLIPFSGGRLKRLSFLRSVEVETVRWWNDVLLPRATSSVGRLKPRLAEVHRMVQEGARAAGNAAGSLDTKVVRWCGEVLVPRSSSIAARLRASHDNAWMRLGIDRRIKHWAEVAVEGWRSVSAALARWQDDVLLPRTRSIAAGFKALHANGSLRPGNAKQRSEHHAQVERQAWEAADAAILRWWSDVLLPRTRSIVARFKALHANGSLRLADAKQRSTQRAQVERQAWEAADAAILRWWYDVLLPRSRSIAARTKATLWHSK